jgi:hypothetical protein
MLFPLSIIHNNILATWLLFLLNLRNGVSFFIE